MRELRSEIKLDIKKSHNFLAWTLTISGVLIAAKSIFTDIDGKGIVLGVISFFIPVLCLIIQRSKINDIIKCIFWSIAPFTVSSISGSMYTVTMATFLMGIGAITIASVYMKSYLTLLTGAYVIVFEAVICILRWDEVCKIFSEKVTADAVITIFILYITITALLFIANLLAENSFNENIKQLKENRELSEKIHKKNIELEETNKELKVVQAHIFQSEKMASLGSLVTGVAHEVNTPLGVGVTAISYLKNKMIKFVKEMETNNLTKTEFNKFVEDITESINIAHSNIEKATNLVQNFKKISVDQYTSSKKNFYIKEYVEDVVFSLKPLIKEASLLVDVKYEGEDNDVEIYSYPGELSQILTNLIVNSIKHGYPGETKKGIITINIKVYKDIVKITYSDDGIGMSEEVRKRNFEPFYTTLRSQGGSGLGMYIAYNLVTSKFKGNILCESRYGEGTTYILEIPINV